MGRTEYNVSTISWIADHNSIVQNSGRKINWDQVVDTDGAGNKKMDSGQIVSLYGDGIAPRKDAEITLSGATEDGAGEATHTASADHGLAVGNTVIIAGYATSEYNGTFKVTSVPTATTFTVEGVTGTPDDDGGGGTATPKAIGFLLESINAGERERSVTGQAVIIGGVFYDNLLPDSSETDFDTFISEVDDSGNGVTLESYEDNRVS